MLEKQFTLLRNIGKGMGWETQFLKCQNIKPKIDYGTSYFGYFEYYCCGLKEQNLPSC